MTNLHIHIMSQYNNLSRAEQKVADYFLKNMNDIYSLPIAELAKRSKVSAGTWVRFCKSIGFDGVKELKQALFNNINMNRDTSDDNIVFTDIKDHQSSKQLVESVQASSVQAIQNTAKVLQVKGLEDAARLIFGAHRICLFGIGASGLVAEDMCQKLLRIGLNASYKADSHIQLTMAATMKPSDVAVLISNSGTTKEIIEIQDLVTKNSVRNIAICSIGKNPLSQHADLVLSTSSPELHHRSGAMSSRIAQLYVVDCLFTMIANKNYEEIDYLLEQSYQVSLQHRVIMNGRAREEGVIN